MTISSLIVECAPEACDAVAAELSARDGVEVYGIDAKQGKVVVTVEADGIDESHRIASDFVSIDTVRGVDLVYANIKTYQSDLGFRVFISQFIPSGLFFRHTRLRSPRRAARSTGADNGSPSRPAACAP